MEEEEIVTRIAKIYLGEDSIVRAAYFPKAEETLTDAKENIAAVAKVSKGQKYPILVDYRKVKSVAREARAYYAGKETAKVVNAVAILIGSLVSRVIANFFLGLNKPKFPVKLFTSEADAIEWLKGFRR